MEEDEIKHLWWSVPPCFCNHYTVVYTGLRVCYCKDCSAKGYLDQGQVVWEKKNE